LTAPTAGALLDLNRGATGGLLLSNVALPNLSVIPANTFVNISTEQDTNQELVGMIVYNTDATTGIGIYVWDGDDWIKPCAPPAPEAITFSGTTICGTTFTAKIDSVKGATSYEWTLPQGLTGTSSDTIITITGTVGTYPAGSITVRAVSSCGGGTRRESALPVTLVAPLLTPGPITFSGTSFCGASTFTAGVATVAGATSYDWTLPTGLDVVGTADGGATITISGAVGTYPTGSISVQAKNSFCSSSPRNSESEIVIGAVPATPGPITFSNTTICGVGTTFTAGVTPVAGATSYEWTLPAGLTISGATNGATITISGAAGTYSAGSITVRAVIASCDGAPSTSTQAVTVVAIPVAPGEIAFPDGTTFCGASTFTAGVTPVAGATSYVWTLPNGLTGSSTGTSITISGDVGAYAAGSISVQAVNSCGVAGAPSSSTQPLTVLAIPAPPTNPRVVNSSYNVFYFSIDPQPDCAVDWYDAATGGTIIFENRAGFSRTLTETTSLFAESRNRTTGCVSASRLEVRAIHLRNISNCYQGTNYSGDIIDLSNVEFINDLTHTRNGITVSAPVKIVGRATKTYFTALSTSNDYRDHQVSNDDPTIDTDTYGSWFSWCMVATHADILCSSPWRVPTRDDMCQYANGNKNITDGIPEIKAGDYGWLPGGYINNSDVIEDGGVCGYYWRSEGGDMYGSMVWARPNYFYPNNTLDRKYGASLRCVKDE
jgi:hypothetical protein